MKQMISRKWKKWLQILRKRYWKWRKKLIKSKKIKKSKKDSSKSIEEERDEKNIINTVDGIVADGYGAGIGSEGERGRQSGDEKHGAG